MTEIPEKELEKELREPSIWYRLRVMATFAIGVWIMLATAWHLYMAIRIAAGPQPDMVTIGLGFPSMAVVDSGTQGVQAEVAPGAVAPGAITGPAGAVSQDNGDDVGVDLRCRWVDGELVGCGLFAGPIALADVPWWLCRLDLEKTGA